MTVTSDVLQTIEDDFDSSSLQQSLEEANQHFIIQEFGRLVLSCGPAAVLGQLDDEARDELKFILKREW
jgi:hypothetical protein|tara:strand:+ start:1630 stop:1836 length:207 start_codon:yes stop_codon:yes gene_type:complete